MEHFWGLFYACASPFLSFWPLVPSLATSMGAHRGAGSPDRGLSKAGSPLVAQ